MTKIPAGIFGARRADPYGWSRIEVGVEINELRWTYGEAKARIEASIAEMPSEPLTLNDVDRRQQAERRLAHIEAVLAWIATIHA